MKTPETTLTITPEIAAAVKPSKSNGSTPTNPRTNPYKRGNYAKLFDWMMSHKGKPFLVSDMVTFAKTLTDKDGNLLGDQKDENGNPTDKAIRATLAVILGPRKESKRGDCRGNASAEGHVYFIQPVAVDFKEMPEGTSKRDWKKSNRKVILRWREPMLEPLYRKGEDGKPMTPKRKTAAKAEKATKATGTTAAKAKGKGKATPKAKPTTKAKPAAKPTTKVTPKAKPSTKAKGKTSFNATSGGYKAEPETPASPETPAAETPNMTPEPAATPAS